jgi:hypothetical protein
MSKIGRAAHEGARKNIKSLSGATTLVQADSGKTLLLDSAAATAITLPELSTVQTGTFYRFVVVLANNAAYTITTGDIADAGGDDFIGSVVYGEPLAAITAAADGADNIGILVPAANDCVITLDADAANGGGDAGTWIECIKVSNDAWLVEGVVLAADVDGTGAGIFTNAN